MNKNILLFRDEEDRCWSVAEGKASTEVEFLENEVTDRMLESDEWIVYETVRGTHKDEYIHSGEIDHLLEE